MWVSEMLGHITTLTLLSRTVMNRERNLDSILELEKQIEEDGGPAIQLKRTRNSLLNVSTLLPPEILGEIFCHNVIRYGDFDRLWNDSHNFLLVCHQWFEVASRTPGLWTFWGSTMQDWTRRHSRYSGVPLDLVLHSNSPVFQRDVLRDALQDRAVRDAIRQVHLASTNGGLINFIISSIVIPGEGVLSSSVESFALWHNDLCAVDVSCFFVRYRLPRLKRLSLSGMCKIPPWDALKSHIMALTSLSLTVKEPPTPTLTQLLSFLSSNPNLQHLVLSHYAVPHADGGVPPSKIRLHHLKRLQLSSHFRRVFQLLNQLELPDEMDDTNLSLSNYSQSDLSQTLAQYIGDCVRRRGWYRGGLGLRAYDNSLSVEVGDGYECGDSTKVAWFLRVSAYIRGTPKSEEVEELCLGLTAHIPHGEVVHLHTNFPIPHSLDPRGEM